MKIRVGVGAGAEVPAGAALGELVDLLEERRFDSLWLSEVLTAPVPDPLAGLAFAAGRVRHLKLGTTMVLPGRNPVRLAKQLATLDQLSEGRLLVTFVLGLNRPGELAALGVDAGDRGRQVDELLPLLRRLWAEPAVDHDGDGWHLRQVGVEPKPAQQPLEAWLGGSVRSALVRTGRLADGWLPSLCTPAECAAGRLVVEESAAAAGRSISPEHFGVSVGYSDAPLPAGFERRLGSGRRPVDPAVVPVGMDALRGLLEQYIAVGFSKFVVRPVVAPARWADELDRLASAVGDLQT